MKYRKKPVVIEAEQWWSNTPHPEVRSYRTPDGDSQDICKLCKITMQFHGWVDTLEGGHIVCPGDWIITGIKGEHYPCKPDVFELTYDKEE